MNEHINQGKCKMKKQIPVIILAIICVVLAVQLYQTKNEIREASQVPAQPEVIASNPGETVPDTEIAPEAVAVEPSQDLVVLTEPDIDPLVSLPWPPIRTLPSAMAVDTSVCLEAAAREVLFWRSLRSKSS